MCIPFFASKLMQITHYLRWNSFAIFPIQTMVLNNMFS